MSVLIFIDQSEGHVKKASFEALSYGSKVAEQCDETSLRLDRLVAGGDDGLRECGGRLRCKPLAQGLPRYGQTIKV